MGMVLVPDGLAERSVDENDERTFKDAALARQPSEIDTPRVVVFSAPGDFPPRGHGWPKPKIGDFGGIPGRSQRPWRDCEWKKIIKEYNALAENPENAADCVWRSFTTTGFVELLEFVNRFS